MTKTCPACSGKRTYEVQSYKMHGGERCGSPITLVYQCESCRGSGVIHCTTCSDSGYMPEFDFTTGEYEGDRPCDHCTRGKIAAEHAAIDAEKDAWERPRSVALTDWHNDNQAAGNPPY